MGQGGIGLILVEAAEDLEEDLLGEVLLGHPEGPVGPDDPGHDRAHPVHEFPGGRLVALPDPAEAEGPVKGCLRGRRLRRPGRDEGVVRVGQVLAGDDGEDARQRERLGSVDLLDDRVGVRAGLQPGVGHPGELDVRPEKGVARHLVDAVRTNRALADDSIFSRGHAPALSAIKK